MACLIEQLLKSSIYRRKRPSVKKKITVLVQTQWHIVDYFIKSVRYFFEKMN